MLLICLSINCSWIWVWGDYHFLLFSNPRRARVKGKEANKQNLKTNKPTSPYEEREKSEFGFRKMQTRVLLGWAEGRWRHLKDRTFHVPEERGLLGLTGFSGDRERADGNLTEEAGRPSRLGPRRRRRGQWPVRALVRAARPGNNRNHIVLRKAESQGNVTPAPEGLVT